MVPGPRPVSGPGFPEKGPAVQRGEGRAGRSVAGACSEEAAAGVHRRSLLQLRDTPSLAVIYPLSHLHLPDPPRGPPAPATSIAESVSYRF